MQGLKTVVTPQLVRTQSACRGRGADEERKRRVFLARSRRAEIALGALSNRSDSRCPIARNRREYPANYGSVINRDYQSSRNCVRWKRPSPISAVEPRYRARLRAITSLVRSEGADKPREILGVHDMRNFKITRNRKSDESRRLKRVFS